MLITKAMPTPQTATSGVSHPIAAGQGITSGLCRALAWPAFWPATMRRTQPACAMKVDHFAPYNSTNLRHLPW